MIKVDFNDYKDCELVYERYYDGNKRLSLVDPEGFHIAVATVNVETTLKPDEVCIKNHSENKGMFTSLKRAGVIEEVVELIEQGHVRIPKVRLSKEVLAEFNPDPEPNRWSGSVGYSSVERSSGT